MDAAVFRNVPQTRPWLSAVAIRQPPSPVDATIQLNPPLRVRPPHPITTSLDAVLSSVARWRSIFLSSGSSSIVNLILLPFCLSRHRFGCLPASGLRLHANNNFVLCTFATCDFATAAIFSSLRIRSTPHLLSRAPRFLSLRRTYLVCDLLQHSFDRRTRPLDRVVSDRGCLVFLQCLFNRSLRISETRKQ